MHRPPPPRYRLLSALAAPLLLGWVARVAWRLRGDPAARPGDWRRFARERLGRGDAGVPDDAKDAKDADIGRTWLHCASVGEVLTAMPLIDALTARDGVAPLVTTATPTGARVLAERAPPDTRHRYLPIDRPGPVARFLDAERPARGGIVETEIWPWLFAAARSRGVPLTILSGRLSARTLEGPARALAPVYRDALRGVRVLARSKADAERFRALAGEAAEVRVAGDLKDAGSIRAAVPDAPLQRRYALAASTHADEETRLASAWVAVAIATRATRTASGSEARAGGEPAAIEDAPLLVIAPRHPDRGDAVHEALRGVLREAFGKPEPGSGTTVARRSSGRLPGSADLVYLADTLGELDAWYAHAAAAFVGGSLVKRGGHNLLEPARWSTPCVTGPHASNFTDALEALRGADAIVVADDADAAVGVLRSGLAGDPGVRALGARAEAVVRGRAEGVLERYSESFGDAREGVAFR